MQRAIQENVLTVEAIRMLQAKRGIGNDRIYSDFLFIIDRICIDLLCRDKFSMGKNDKSGEYAAGCFAGDSCFVSAMGILRVESR